MTQAAQKIISDFMALDPDERELVAAQVFDLMHEAARDPGYDEAWDTEIQRRIEQIDRGEAKLIPMDEAMKMIGRGRMNEEG